MSVKSITFEQLKTEIIKRAGLDDMPSAKQIPNAKAALAGFLEERGLSASAVVGKTLREDYPAAIAEHSAALDANARSSEYCRNRRWLLTFWKELVRVLDLEEARAANAPLPLQAALMALFAKGRRRTPTARIIGVSNQTLRRWLNGEVPDTAHSGDAIKSLESLCELAPGALTGLLPRNARATAKKLPPDELAERMRRLQEDHFALPPAAMEVHAVLRPQWDAYLIERTLNSDTSGVAVALTLERINRKNAASALSLEDPLRLRAPRQGEKVHWYENVEGNRCPTAGKNCEVVRRFLGWSMKSVEDGGAGVALEALTLAMVADADLITRYFTWNLVRRGAPTATDLGILQTFKTMLTADKGFVVRSPSVGATVGFADPAAWAAHCATERAKIVDLRRRWIKSAKKPCDPKERLAGVLKLEEPIEAFLRGSKRLEADAYSTKYYGQLRKFHPRDLVLFNLVLSNPLRAENYSGLIYHADNTGELHKKPDGAWHITIPWWKMKNLNGAAKDTDYDMEVNPIVWPHIEAYLKVRDQFRASEYFFAPCPIKGTLNYITPGQLSASFRSIVKEYVPEQPRGCGIHGMRHVWATHIVAKYQDFMLAAQILHDSPDTISRSYAHAMPEAGRRKRDRLVAPMLSGVPFAT